MRAQRWVVVDPRSREIVFPASGWRGPEGDGHLWSHNADGTVWTSELGEVRTAPADLDQWVPPDVGQLALEAWAQQAGYTLREQPAWGNQRAQCVLPDGRTREVTGGDPSGHGGP